MPPPDNAPYIAALYRPPQSAHPVQNIDHFKFPAHQRVSKHEYFEPKSERYIVLHALLTSESAPQQSSVSSAKCLTPDATTFHYSNKLQLKPSHDSFSRDCKTDSAPYNGTQLNFITPFGYPE